ncbi:MAG: peptidylprolyl isomerase [Verrucomicrobiota bacterium]
MTLYDLEKVPIRLILWALAGVYLIADLGIQGPLYDRFTGSESIQKIGREQNWACTVGGEPITKAQLNLALDLHLARRGKSRSNLPPKNLKIAQLAVLDEMISNELIRQWSRVFPIDLDPELVDSRIAQFESHFAPGDLKDVCTEQSLSQGDLRSLLTLHLKQELWLEEKIRQATTVQSSDSEKWFELNQNSLTAPEVVRARHIFVSTAIENTPERKAQILEIFSQLQSKTATFEDLASTFSEDERTKMIGGDLGYFSRRRMPEDFCKIVFDLEPGQISPPFQTQLGWHIVELIEKIESQNLQMSKIQNEIEALLENEWRSHALDQLLNQQLRTTTRAKVIMFPAALQID